MPCVPHGLPDARYVTSPSLVQTSSNRGSIVLDGFGATRRIRRLEAEGVLPRRLRVIALTANVTTESEDACRAAGMDAFLPKPLKITGMSYSVPLQLASTD